MPPEVGGTEGRRKPAARVQLGPALLGALAPPLRRRPGRPPVRLAQRTSAVPPWACGPPGGGAPHRSFVGDPRTSPTLT